MSDKPEDEVREARERLLHEIRERDGEYGGYFECLDRFEAAVRASERAKHHAQWCTCEGARIDERCQRMRSGGKP